MSFFGAAVCVIIGTANASASKARSIRQPQPREAPAVDDSTFGLAAALGAEDNGSGRLQLPNRNRRPAVAYNRALERQCGLNRVFSGWATGRRYRLEGMRGLFASFQRNLQGAKA
jgi:hypothetical protein